MSDDNTTTPQTEQPVQPTPKEDAPTVSKTDLGAREGVPVFDPRMLAFSAEETTPTPTPAPTTKVPKVPKTDKGAPAFDPRLNPTPAPSVDGGGDGGGGDGGGGGGATDGGGAGSGGSGGGDSGGSAGSE